MTLRTLGRLMLSGGDFRQDKPLLLAVYLALEGPKPRKFMAELFWPKTVKPMESLAGAVFRLRKHQLVEADGTRVWAKAGCDALELCEHLKAGRLKEAIELYGGAFAEGLVIEMGEELEEWLLETRERLAGGVRMALLTLAEQEAARGAFAEAAAKAEAAYNLPGADVLEAEEIIRVHRLLLAAEHSLKETLVQEAEDLGISLGQSVEEARNRLYQTMIGRKKELETLVTLKPGEWAWVQGGDGMGKTTLLRQLEGKGNWRYVPARSGLPFATLEPLFADVGGGEEVLVRGTARLNQDLLFDDWENIDPESQKVLVRLRNLRPGFRVVLAGHGEPSVRVDQHLHLRVLLPEELTIYPGVHEATGGVPELVRAFLANETLEPALEKRLQPLSHEARKVYLSLAMLGISKNPQLPLVRRALDFTDDLFQKGRRELFISGLIDETGEVRVREKTLEWLHTQPDLERELSLALAQVLPAQEAFSFYKRARELGSSGNTPGLEAAYLTYSKEILRRGYPQKAADILAELDPSPQINLAYAKALEQSGQYNKALNLIVGSTDEAAYALKSALYYRLGDPIRAKESAEKVLHGDVSNRAAALNTLGHLCLGEKDWKRAISNYRRSAALWSTLGETHEYARALTNLALARCELGEDPESAFAMVLKIVQSDPLQEAQAWLNLGMFLGRLKREKEASSAFQKAVGLSRESGSINVMIRALCNLGVVQHVSGELDAAERTYLEALELAREGGEPQIQASILANLAELKNDLDALEEAIRLLKRVGHLDMATRFSTRLEKMRNQFSEYPSQSVSV